MWKRTQKIIKPLIMAGILGFIYIIWLKITDLGIQCVFYLWTGLKCPGCGITHMCMAVLNGDIEGARRENIFLFYMLPILGLYWAADSMKYIITGRYLDKRITNILLWTTVATLLIFGVCRNIIGC